VRIEDRGGRGLVGVEAKGKPPKVNVDRSAYLLARERGRTLNEIRKGARRGQVYPPRSLAGGLASRLSEEV
jgi:hypothetical protein